jgi:transposase
MSEAKLDDAHQDSHQERHQGGGYRWIELITGEARRRPWTAEEKAGILAESFQPGAKAADVARRHGMNRSPLGGSDGGVCVESPARVPCQGTCR